MRGQSRWTRLLWHLPFDNFFAHFRCAQRPAVSWHVDPSAAGVTWQRWWSALHWRFQGFAGRHMRRFASVFMQTFSAFVKGCNPSRYTSHPHNKAAGGGGCGRGGGGEGDGEGGGADGGDGGSGGYNDAEKLESTERKAASTESRHDVSPGPHPGVSTVTAVFTSIEMRSEAGVEGHAACIAARGCALTDWPTTTGIPGTTVSTA